MPTRHTATNNELHQQRYFSAVEFVEQRPLNGMAVGERARLLDHPLKRRIVWFLQSKSMSPGLPEFSRQLLAMFPDRLGTPSMHEANVSGGGIYPAGLLESVQLELGSDWHRQAARVKRQRQARERVEAQIAGEPEATDSDAEDRKEVVSGSTLLNLCADAAAGLPRHLAELCLDPGKPLPLPDERGSIDRSTVEAPYFRGLIEALILFMDRQAAAAREEFAVTSIARVVIDELDRCLKTRRAVLVKGETGIGKSEAAAAWCKAHEGEARRISLTSVCNRTTLFHAIAKSVGIDSSSRSASKLEVRIRDVFKESGLMLIIEEFHFAFPRTRRITAQPELPDWVYGALIEERVPVALVSTPQINKLIRTVADQTGWNEAQWARRVRRWVDLPEEPTRDDLKLVAHKLMPEADVAMLKAAVGFAGRVCQQFDALRDLIDEARITANEDGRDKLTAKDILAALEAVAGIHKSKTRSKPRKSSPDAPTEDEELSTPRRGNAAAGRLQVPGGDLAEGIEERFALVASGKN